MTPVRTMPPLPERIEGLWSIALNLSWSWSRIARALFRAIDYPLWSLLRHNPIELLRRVAPERLALVAQDPEFLELYDAAIAAAARETSTADTWFTKAYPSLEPKQVAYFCA